jgi:hypothetical protein
LRLPGLLRRKNRLPLRSALPDSTGYLPPNWALAGSFSALRTLPYLAGVSQYRRNRAELAMVSEPDECGRFGAPARAAHWETEKLKCVDDFSYQ